MLVYHNITFFKYLLTFKYVFLAVITFFADRAFEVTVLI